MSHRPARRWSRAAALSAAVVLLPALGTGSLPAAEASPSEQDAALTAFVWDDVNHARASRGLPRLLLHPEMAAASQDVADRNAASGELRHGSAYGLVTPTPSGTDRSREIVAMHPAASGAGASVDAWLASDGHRAAMLSGEGAIGGAGVATRDGRRMATVQIGEGPRQQVRFADAGVHATSIHRLADAGITGGCGGDRYCPSDALTRGQMATFLARAAVERPRETDAFRDVTRGTPHGHNIGAIAQAGVTAGCDADRFCPTRTVTRAQLATFLTRALDLPAGDVDGFVDVPRDHPHAAGIGALVRADITAGCAADRFCPEAPVTRGQVAAFLDRAGLA